MLCQRLKMTTGIHYYQSIIHSTTTPATRKRKKQLYIRLELKAAITFKEMVLLHIFIYNLMHNCSTPNNKTKHHTPTTFYTTATTQRQHAAN